MGQKTTKREIYTLAILLITLAHEIHSTPVKNAARPVYEVINENARSDVDIDELTHDNPSLPYSNPLAGNSQGAKQHALNQQAMFNAERIRQHRAQLQRWRKIPQQVDSYMKAYHESQENHHLALEKLQGETVDITPPEIEKKSSKTVTDLPQTKSTMMTRREVNLKTKDTIKDIYEDQDAIDSDSDKSRNHRSYGSADINTIGYKTVYVDGRQNHENSVTIKPYSNIGSTTLNLHAPEGTQSTKLYTEAILNNIKYEYPKEELQKQSYKAAQNTETYSSLLKKLPYEQFTHSNALVDARMASHDNLKVLNQPIDLFFYLKEANPQTFQKHIASPESDPEKDHKPITEAVDDIEDPQGGKAKSYGFENQLIKEQSKELKTKNNDYYGVEVASETISGLKPAHHSQIKQPFEYYTRHQENKPALYGVHSLSEDGTDISAYDFENVSISDKNYQKNRSKRKRRSDVEIDTTPFILPNNKTITGVTVTPENTQNYSANTSTPEALILKVNGFIPVNRKKINTFLTTPKFPIGEAIDYDYIEPKRINRLKYNKYESVYEDDEDLYDDDDYQNAPSLSSENIPQVYAPTASYNLNSDLDVNPSETYRKLKRYRRPSTNYGVPANSYEYPSNSYGVPSNSYGMPISSYAAPVNSYGVPTNSYGNPSDSYGAPPNSYGIPSNSYLVHSSPHDTASNFYGAPSNSYGVPPHAEPVYLLSESQLQRLLHYAANYEFGYRVHDHHSGNDFGHHEVKENGDTKGFYHVLLPDGRTQKVKYHAGADGFHADISYDHLQH